MMAVSMWRMNGLWRRMAVLLVLCALLLNNEVSCQDDATPEPAVSADPNAGGADAAATDAPSDSSAATGGDDSAATAGDTAMPTTGQPETMPSVQIDADDSPKMVVPEVNCVAKEDIQEDNAVKAVVGTDDCEATKQIIQNAENAAGWCHSETCNLNIFQDGNTALVSSPDSKLGTLASALMSDEVKDKLGVTETETPSSSSNSAVLAGMLVTGLLAAIAITVGYFKCQRRPDAKAVRLAEEATPVDPENQANTLASEAPLNPPPETPEKPAVNGESPEAPKTEPAPPPTNGHSTAKTADTEL